MFLIIDGWIQKEEEKWDDDGWWEMWVMKGDSEVEGDKGWHRGEMSRDDALDEMVNRATWWCDRICIKWNRWVNGDCRSYSGLLEDSVYRRKANLLLLKSSTQYSEEMDNWEILRGQSNPLPLFPCIPITSRGSPTYSITAITKRMRSLTSSAERWNLERLAILRPTSTLWNLFQSKNFFCTVENLKKILGDLNSWLWCEGKGDFRKYSRSL